MNPENDDRIVAMTDIVRRTGAKEFQIRFSDEEEPVAWMAVAVYPDGRFDVGGGRDPIQATERLCDQLIDGGICMHCNRPTGFTLDTDSIFFRADPPRYPRSPAHKR